MTVAVVGAVSAGLLAAIALLVALIVALGAAALVLRRRARQQQRLLAITQDKLEQLQRQFEHFVPADVVEQLTAGPGSYGARRCTATMLFADLRGFTALCDRLDPAVAVDILNEYFRRMNAAITGHHGHINELVGDGLLALFGALEHNPWQARDAVLAALDMRAELARYNAELRARSLPELRFGIGIHSGEVVAGVMGAGALNKFTVTGDPINVASRVEGLTAVHKVDLLVTDQIRSTIDDQFILRRMPAVPVKGKPEPIVTYHVEGIAGAAPPARPVEESLAAHVSQAT
jgi:adenylate cyclase